MPTRQPSFSNAHRTTKLFECLPTATTLRSPGGIIPPKVEYTTRRRNRMIQQNCHPHVKCSVPRDARTARPDCLDHMNWLLSAVLREHRDRRNAKLLNLICSRAAPLCTPPSRPKAKELPARLLRCLLPPVTRRPPPASAEGGALARRGPSKRICFLLYIFFVWPALYLPHWPCTSRRAAICPLA